MGRILAVDYGTKRVGLAMTDPLKLFASPLKTVDESEAMQEIVGLSKRQGVESIVIGLPTRLNGEDTHATEPTRLFAAKIRSALPEIPIIFEEETFTSKQAVQVMIRAGMKKKERRKKENIDRISASIILQAYLDNLNDNIATTEI